MNFTKLFVALFASLFLVSVASAMIFNPDPAIVSQSATSVAHNAGSFTVIFNVTNAAGANSGVANLTYVPVSGTVSSVSFSQNPVTLGNGTTATITATINFPAFQTGTISGRFNADDTTGTGADTLSNTFTVTLNTSTAYTLTKTAEVTPSQNGSLTLTNTGNQALTFSLVKASGALNVSFSNSNPTVTVGSTTTVTVSPTAGQTFRIGTSSAVVTAVHATGNQSVTFTRTGGFCPAGKVTTNLTLRDVELTSSGDEDDEWHVIDEVSVEVEIENTGSSDLEDLIVELGLFDSNGNNVADELDFTSEGEEEFDVGDLDDGDDTKIEFTFKVPADIDEGSYTLILKAFSDDVSQSSLCTDSVAESIQETIQVKSEDDEGKFIAFDDITVSPTQVTCGDSVTITADAINIGEDDEDRVLINLVNRVLGVNEIVEITQGLDQGDSKMVSFSFTVPQVADNTYTLDLSAEYDYRNGVYRQSLDDDVETQLKVFGCSAAPGTTNAVSINADLASDAVTGEELKVTTTLRNNGDKTALFAVTATGFESWASLKDISENIVQIPAGQSKDITITLMPQDDAAGEQSFTINARTEDGKIQSRQVVVQVASDSLFDGSSWTWVLIAVNVVLVILIIVVAVIVSRR
ncbi:putative S-layer protein [Candidatus Pacearchaeota archaeon]|nr:putative S-layer protein [Candidatus Pacearchaeota archaeon]